MKFFFITSAVILLAMQLKAQAPNELNYQGVARNITGDLIPNQKIGLEFAVRQAGADSAIVYEETQTVTTNQFGLFTVAIGRGTVIKGSMAAINWKGKSEYLQVGMDPTGGNSYITMDTTQFLSVPYALNSGSSTWPWAAQGSSIYNLNSGSVGIGTATPILGAELETVANDSSNGIAYGVYGYGASTKGVGYGVYGIGAPTGVYGFASGNGVIDTNLGPKYTNSHVVGLLGEVTGGPGTNNTTENDGILAVSTNTDAYVSIGSFNFGGGASVSNYGSYSVAQANGNSFFNYGVYGDIDTVPGTYGCTNFAGYFHGNVTVTGDINVLGDVNKSGGNFKIDDPIDPANKYLYHSFVESPDMMNVYNGNIITDGYGNATVELPHYFETENKDFKYQLTVIGQFAQAIVATEISNNAFTIKTDKPNVKVSWQVTGVRNDPWANKNRTIAEVDKQGLEKGRYLSPELYGQPETKSINYLMIITNKNNEVTSFDNLKKNVVKPLQAPSANGDAAAK